MKPFFIGVMTVILTLKCYSQDWQHVLLGDGPNPLFGFVGATSFQDTVIILGFNGKIYHSENFGVSWRIDSSFKGVGPDGIAFADREIGYITTDQVQGGLLKSINGGESWQPLSSGPLMGVHIGSRVVFTHPDIGYAAFVYDSKVSYTTDSGLNWPNALVDFGTCWRTFRLTFVNDSTGYLLGNSLDDPGFETGNLLIYKTTNFAHSWQLVSDLPITGYGDMEFIDDTTSILVSKRCILKSKNSCISFDTVMYSTDPMDAFATLSRSVSFANRDTGYVAYFGSVYRTYDAGDTWSKTSFNFQNFGQSNIIDFIKAATGSKVIVGCTLGDVYLTNTAGGMWSNLNKISQESIKVYPNPSYETINITGLESMIGMTGAIYTSEGQLIMKFKILDSNVKLDISNVLSEAYYIFIDGKDGKHIGMFYKK